MLRTILLMVAWWLPVMYAHAQLRGNSYLNETEMSTLKTTFLNSNQHVMGVYGSEEEVERKRKELRNCSFNRLAKVSPYGSLSIVRVYSCSPSIPKKDIHDFETDFSEVVVAHCADYHFFEKATNGHESEMFSVLRVYLLGDGFVIKCESKFEVQWNKIKKTAEHRGWRLGDLILYRVHWPDDRQQKLWRKILLCYQGVSYIWIDDELILLKDYLKSNFTLEEYRNSFFQ